MESIVRTISEKKLINTGFLHGPFCPIYGIGAIILFAFLDKFENNLILLFFVAIIVLTIWEYVVGWMLEKLFNTKYWDFACDVAVELAIMDLNIDALQEPQDTERETVWHLINKNVEHPYAEKIY